MLTSDERRSLKNLIEEQISEIEASLKTMSANSKAVEPDRAIGRLSRYDSMVNAGTVQMAMAEAQKKLTRLRGKLSQIDDPEFGKCAMCGEWISRERLFAAPDRGVCVECLRKK